MNNTTLLLHCNDFTDSSLSPKEVINNGAIIDNDGKFGKSIELTSSKYLQVKDGLKTIDLSKDFTFDWWEYSLGSTDANNVALFTNRIATDSANKFKGLVFGYSGQYIYAGTQTATSWDIFSGVKFKDINVGQWVHWALVKKGNIWTSYKNGAKFWTQETPSVPGGTDGNNCTIGAYVDGNINSGYNAKIDEFRVSNVARWNSNFSVPVREYATSPQIHIKEQTSTSINFSVEYEEKINKVEVFVNDTKIETFTSNYNDLNFVIDNQPNTYIVGENTIKILVTYLDTETVDISVVHNVCLLRNASLKDVVDKIEEISLIDFNFGLDIVVKNEVPSYFKEGQLCIIPNKKCSKVIIDSMSYEDVVLNDGDIYIQTCDTEGEVTITSKSNTQDLSVNLKKVVQRNSNEIVGITNVYICKDNKWNKLFDKFYLFSDGVFNAKVGDFKLNSYQTSNWYEFKIEKNKPGYVNNIYLEDYLGGTDYGTSISTPNMLNLSNYSKVVLVETSFYHSSQTSQRVRFGVSNPVNTFAVYKDIQSSGSSADDGKLIKHELDITSILDGEYFIAIRLKKTSSSSNINPQFYIKEIYLER